MNPENRFSEEDLAKLEREMSAVEATTEAAELDEPLIDKPKEGIVDIDIDEELAKQRLKQEADDMEGLAEMIKETEDKEAPPIPKEEGGSWDE